MPTILKPSHETNECHELKKQEVLSKASLCISPFDGCLPMVQWFIWSWILTSKTEIYCLSHSVQLFKCFKWDTFKTIFSMKNETCKNSTCQIRQKHFQRALSLHGQFLHFSFSTIFWSLFSNPGTFPLFLFLLPLLLHQLVQQYQ